MASMLLSVRVAVTIALALLVASDARSGQGDSAKAGREQAVRENATRENPTRENVVREKTELTTADLTETERARAIAIGRTCQAPIILLPAGRRDFDVYIEGPFARVALVAATALMMNASV